MGCEVFIQFLTVFYSTLSDDKARKASSSTNAWTSHASQRLSNNNTPLLSSFSSLSSVLLLVLLLIVVFVEEKDPRKLSNAFSATTCFTRSSLRVPSKALAQRKSHCSKDRLLLLLLFISTVVLEREKRVESAALGTLCIQCTFGGRSFVVGLFFFRRF